MTEQQPEVPAVPRPHPSPVPDEVIDAALAADIEWMRISRSVVFRSCSRDQVRMMLEAAWVPEHERAERAEAKVAAARETVETFLRHYGHSTSASFQQALDLAHGVRQVLDRDEGEGCG